MQLKTLHDLGPIYNLRENFHDFIPSYILKR